MISDDKLKKISLLVTLFGMIMIYIVTLVSPQQVLIRDIKESNAGKQVAINGTIADYRTSDGNLFLKVNDGTGIMYVVMFERTARNRDVYLLKKNDIVLVEGQINIYKDGLEIVANSIIKAE